MAHPRPRVRLRRWSNAAVSLSLLVGVTACDAGSDEAGTQMADSASFRGDGDQETPAFEAGDNWELTWSTEADEFTVELLGDDGASRGTLVEEQAGEGSTFVSEAGEFTLQVTADAAWEIDIATPEG